MKSEQQLVESFKSIGYQPNTGGIALKTLSITLSSDERILEIIEGGCENTVGVLVATDIRLLYVGCSPLKDSVIKSINYHEISSLYFKESPFPSGSIVIYKSSECIKVAGCDIEKSTSFIDLITNISQERKDRSQDLDDLNH